MSDWTTEQVDAHAFEIKLPSRHRFDAVARNRFPDPAQIQPLFLKAEPPAPAEKPKKRRWTEFLSPKSAEPVQPEAAPAPEHSGHFLVTIGANQWMLRVTDSEVARLKLKERVDADVIEFGDLRLVKADYSL